MCSCLHRVHFQALGETNPSHQTQYLNSPWVIFHPSSSEVQHHFISQTRQQAAICYKLLMVRAYKAEPNCRTQNYNFRIVPYCPWRLSADFSIPFSPQPLWKYTELHCFPEDLHLPSTFPHHFWIISLIAFGDWKKKYIFIYGNWSLLHPLIQPSIIELSAWHANETMICIIVLCPPHTLPILNVRGALK